MKKNCTGNENETLEELGFSEGEGTSSVVRC